MLLRTYFCVSISFAAALCFPQQSALRLDANNQTSITPEFFAELEELSRVVDISYCVGSLGIHEPFKCASRCEDFPDFQLVTTFNTGILLSDSCGYVALAHNPSAPRIIVAFRGTYSIANTIIDLSTVPQEFVPYPDSSNQTELGRSPMSHGSKCNNCTVHSGFYTAWLNTRPVIISHVKKAKRDYPDYQLSLVGHSLGGAVAALASLEFAARGWHPKVTTFGEPRIGNKGLVDHLDQKFNLEYPSSKNMYRRITHIDDPVPLLPLTEWGYRAHAGEIYITKSGLPPTADDMRICTGDEDPDCIAGADDSLQLLSEPESNEQDWKPSLESFPLGLSIPARYKIWQLFFAHRDYFWRLGVCLPGGDPFDWSGDPRHPEVIAEL